MSTVALSAILPAATNGRVLPDLTAAARMDDIAAQIAALKAENAALKQAAKTANQAEGLRLKVSEKGALSVYGLARFPVTLYKSQWLKLFTVVDQIKAFILANDAALATKG
jgi:hypothetical protein